jgi:hypothetical protein
LVSSPSVINILRHPLVGASTMIGRIIHEPALPPQNKGEGSSEGLRCVALHSSILLGIGTGADILFTGTLSQAM